MFILEILNSRITNTEYHLGRFCQAEKWILELTEVFVIEVYAYTVMHNHYRLVVYVEPQLARDNGLSRL